MPLRENQNVEWKESWHDDYLKWVCGFANAQGDIPPDFIVTPRTFTVVFHTRHNALPPEYQNSDSTDESTRSNDGAMFGVNGGVSGGVNALQTEILHCMRLNPSVSILKLSKQLEKPRRTVENNIAKLKSLGILARVGADKNGHWKILQLPTPHQPSA
jgi:predicted HTH transcriptional regulator